jgi:hypothetical protein
MNLIMNLLGVFILLLGRNLIVGGVRGRTQSLEVEEKRQNKRGKTQCSLFLSLSLFLFVTKPTKTDFALKENAYSQRFGFTLKDVLPICYKL